MHFLDKLQLPVYGNLMGCHLAEMFLVHVYFYQIRMHSFASEAKMLNTYEKIIVPTHYSIMLMGK